MDWLVSLQKGTENTRDIESPVICKDDQISIASVARDRIPQMPVTTQLITAFSTLVIMDTTMENRLATSEVLALSTGGKDLVTPPLKNLLMVQFCENSTLQLN